MTAHCYKALVGAMAIAVLAVAVACPSPALADPPIVALLDIGRGGATIKGELRFDLGGGPVSGLADLDLPANPQSPPLNAAGTAVSGRYRLHVDLQGNYRGGLYGVLSGSARLSGTFTEAAGCVSALDGTGTFKGSVTGSTGTAELIADWEKVNYRGCGLASPQPFSMDLPFGFPAVTTPPTLTGAGQMPAANGPTPAGEPAPAGLPWQTVALLAAAGLCCVSAVGAAGVAIGVIVRRRSVRATARVPDYLPEPVLPPERLQQRGAGRAGKDRAGRPR